jgi:hypothetical protein
LTKRVECRLGHAGFQHFLRERKHQGGVGVAGHDRIGVCRGAMPRHCWTSWPVRVRSSRVRVWACSLGSAHGPIMEVSWPEQVAWGCCLAARPGIATLRKAAVAGLPAALLFLVPGMARSTTSGLTLGMRSRIPAGQEPDTRSL